MPCSIPTLNISLSNPHYTPGDIASFNIASTNATYATIKVIDMSAYLEVDTRKKGEVSRVSQVMIENEIYQRYGRKGEMWYAKEYIDWMYT